MPPVERTEILRIAVEAKLDPRTVQRALEHGMAALRTEYDRERLRAALVALGHADLIK